MGINIESSLALIIQIIILTYTNLTLIILKNQISNFEYESVKRTNFRTFEEFNPAIVYCKVLGYQL